MAVRLSGPSLAQRAALLSRYFGYRKLFFPHANLPVPKLPQLVCNQCADLPNMISSNAMRFRKLRITWSVFCGIVCVLLIVLWVRSYRPGDIIVVRKSPYSRTMFVSRRGLIDYASDTAFEPMPFSEGYRVTRMSDDALVVNRERAGVITFPHWLPVFLAGAFVAAPWVRWST